MSVYKIHILIDLWENFTKLSSKYNKEICDLENDLLSESCLQSYFDNWCQNSRKQLITPLCSNFYVIATGKFSVTLLTDKHNLTIPSEEHVNKNKAITN